MCQLLIYIYSLSVHKKHFLNPNPLLARKSFPPRPEYTVLFSLDSNQNIHTQNLQRDVIFHRHFTCLEPLLIGLRIQIHLIRTAHSTSQGLDRFSHSYVQHVPWIVQSLVTPQVVLLSCDQTVPRSRAVSYCHARALITPYHHHLIVSQMKAQAGEVSRTVLLVLMIEMLFINYSKNTAVNLTILGSTTFLKRLNTSYKENVSLLVYIMVKIHDNLIFRYTLSFSNFVFVQTFQDCFVPKYGFSS